MLPEEKIISPLLEASNIFYAKINKDDTITWSENASKLIKETKKIGSRNDLVLFLKRKLTDKKPEILKSIENGKIKDQYITHFHIFKKKIYAILSHQVNDQFYVLFQDVTKIKKKEDNLQERWELLRNAQKAAKLINYEYDFIKRKSTWSNEVFKNIGYKPDELAPNLKNFQKIIYPEDKSFVIKSILNSIWKRKDYNISFRIITKSGKVIWVKDSGRAIYNQFGLPIKASGILQDISVEKRIEDELIREKKRAEESDILKSTFLANMSHEIRTPLNGILGFSQLLSKQGIEQHKREKYISIINNSGEHLMSIISDVIDIAKIESGQIKINKQKIKLNPVLKELQEMFNERLLALNKSEIELTCHTSHPDKDYQIETDIIRLRQILNNLIYNAIKFTEKGSIEFGYYIKNKVIVFYVKDTGLGISSKKQKIIFERFRQEDEGHSRSYTGSGLGLTICRSLLELMEGEIWLNSQKGKGSVFYFSLPLTN